MLRIIYFYLKKCESLVSVQGERVFDLSPDARYIQAERNLRLVLILMRQFKRDPVSNLYEKKNN